MMVDLTPYNIDLRKVKTHYISDNPRSDFLSHLSESGFTPPKILKDGVIDRIDDPTDKKGKGSGWYIFNQYENIAIASYGSWKESTKHTWTSKSQDTLSFAEKVKLSETIKSNEEKRKSEERERHNIAASESLKYWSKLPDAGNDNPYLKRKGVKPCKGLKEDGDVLIMPITLDDCITSYQKIYPNGDKRMKTGGRKKGCYFIIEGNNSTIYISEGLSTGLSIHEATGNTVCVAIDCGNLYEATQNIKSKYPESHIILAGENNDANKSKCEQISFPAVYPPDETHDDFNDMHVAFGIDAVREFLKPEKVPTKIEPVKKEEGFKFGGVLDQIIDYYNATSGNNQPLFAVQSAIASCSVMLGRNFKTSYDNYSSMFMLNLAKSGTGKEHGKKIIEKILYATNNDHLIGGDGYTSGSAVISALLSKPRHITIIDEFSKSIEAANNKNGGSHLKEANSKIMECFGRQDGVIRARAYATIGLSKDKKDQISNQYVMNPSLTLLCMSTPDDFFNNVGEGAIKDGFLNRFVICISDAEPTIRQYKKSMDVPQSIIEWDEKIKSRHENHIEIATEKPNVIEIKFTMSCLEEQRKFEQECIDLANEMDEFNLSDVPMRANEISMRLALIIALSEDPNAETIRIDHIKKATEWIRFNLLKTIKTLKMSVSGSAFEADKKLILKALRKKSISKTEMGRRSPYSRYKPKDLNEILQALKESGLADIEEVETKGRTKIVWTAT